MGSAGPSVAPARREGEDVRSLVPEDAVQHGRAQGREQGERAVLRARVAARHRLALRLLLQDGGRRNGLA